MELQQEKVKHKNDPERYRELQKAVDAHITLADLERQMNDTPRGGVSYRPARLRSSSATARRRSSCRSSTPARAT